MRYWAIYLLAINAISFITFGLDKTLAKLGAWRISERTLFMLAIIGGSIGAILGMKVFRHKTLKNSFKMGLPFIFFAQVILVAGLFFWYYI